MQEGKIEGIVLRSQEFKERQRIITLFSPQGVLSLIVKGISLKKSPLLALTTPFSHGEYHFIKKNSELLFFQDGVVLNEHLDLRSSLQQLKTAGALAQAILRSQWPGKASEALFTVYKAYHQQVSCITNWQALLASFYLKLLKLEGAFFFSKEMEHNEDCSLIFLSQKERELLIDLAGIQRFSALENRRIESALLGKVEKLFESML